MNLPFLTDEEAVAKLTAMLRLLAVGTEESAALAKAIAVLQIRIQDRALEAA